MGCYVRLAILVILLEVGICETAVVNRANADPIPVAIEIIPKYTLADLGEFVGIFAGQRTTINGIYEWNDLTYSFSTNGYIATLTERRIGYKQSEKLLPPCSHLGVMTVYIFDMRDIENPDPPEAVMDNGKILFWKMALKTAKVPKPIYPPAPAEQERKGTINQTVSTLPGSCNDAPIGQIGQGRRSTTEIPVVFTDYYLATRFGTMISATFPRYVPAARRNLQ